MRRYDPNVKAEELVADIEMLLAEGTSSRQRRFRDWEQKSSKKNRIIIRPTRKNKGGHQWRFQPKPLSSGRRLRADDGRRVDGLRFDFAPSSAFRAVERAVERADWLPLPLSLHVESPIQKLKYNYTAKKKAQLRPISWSFLRDSDHIPREAMRICFPAFIEIY